MGDFLLRDVNSENIDVELDTIGFDRAYLQQACGKFDYKNIKIYGLTSAQANILKQTALIYGSDCAVNRNVITGSVEKSDVILCGSLTQLRKIAKKLGEQPFKLGKLGNEILQMLTFNKKKTKLVGILNLTPNSFSDGGLYLNPEDGIKKVLELIESEADIIDIGAESTKPYSEPVPNSLQIERLKPILHFIQKEKPDITISVDTKSSEVADFALNNGANIINDVSGLDYDFDMAKVVSSYNAGIVIQHSNGRSENVRKYENVVDEVFLALKAKIDNAKSQNINNIIIDPGIGFSKSREDNLKLLDNIEAFYSLDVPVMLGVSRKSVLGAVDESNDVKDALSLAYSYPLIKKGVDYLRVHNVNLHKTLLKSMPI